MERKSTTTVMQSPADLLRELLAARYGTGELAAKAGKAEPLASPGDDASRMAPKPTASTLFMAAADSSHLARAAAPAGPVAPTGVKDGGDTPRSDISSVPESDLHRKAPETKAALLPSHDVLPTGSDKTASARLPKSRERAIPSGLQAILKIATSASDAARQRLSHSWQARHRKRGGREAFQTRRLDPARLHAAMSITRRSWSQLDPPLLCAGLAAILFVSLMASIYMRSGPTKASSTMVQRAASTSPGQPARKEAPRKNSSWPRAPAASGVKTAAPASSVAKKGQREAAMAPARKKFERAPSHHRAMSSASKVSRPGKIKPDAK